jgi:hypothetical protein
LTNAGEEDAFAFLHDHERNLLYLTLGLSLASERGAHLYEDANPGRFFIDKPTIILGSYVDMRSIIYFWNTRASYPFNRTLWLPVELIGVPQLNLHEYTHLGFSRGLEGDPRVQVLRAGKQVVDLSRYYFPHYTSRWLSFEHTSTVSVIDSRIKIDHPSHKLFSRSGVNMNVALEVQGLEEMLAPPSAAVGRLFAHEDINPLGFRRIGVRGFVSRIRQFEIFRDASLHEDLSLPSDYAVMQAIFSERGYHVDTTNISAVMEQLRGILGGYGAVEVLARENSWRLINRLAPKRTQRIIDEIRMAGLNLGSGAERELASRLAAVPSLGQQLTQTLSQLEGNLQIKKAEKPQFHSLVQELYGKGLLLRGKSVQCVHCKSKLWFPLESLSRPLRCYCCNSLLVLPVAPSTEAEDSYRLNELLVQAVDQGLLAMLLTMRVLWGQRFFGRRLLPSLLIYRQGDEKPLLEADIVFTLGKDLGLCEVKTDQDFDLKQADELISLAEVMRADVVVFSTMKESSDQAVAGMSKYIQERGAGLPVLILTRSVLLGSSMPQLIETYRVAYMSNRKNAVFVL